MTDSNLVVASDAILSDAPSKGERSSACPRTCGAGLALVERKGMVVRVIGAPPKKPRAVRKREAEPPRREGMLPD